MHLIFKTTQALLGKDRDGWGYNLLEEFWRHLDDKITLIQSQRKSQGGDCLADYLQ